MAEAYDIRARASAARKLAPISQGGKGQEVTLHQPGSDGVFDPATETTTGATSPVDHDSSGVEEAYSAFSISSGVVAAGDIKFLLSPLKVDGTPMPQPESDGWTLTKADGTWTIKRIEPLSPAGTDVLFTLQLRK